MDLNELLRQHQIALISAENGQCGQQDHELSLIRDYERRIANLRTELGVRQY